MLKIAPYIQCEDYGRRQCPRRGRELMRDWKLTKRGEQVAYALEVAGTFVALWGGAWIVWALLNTLLGKG
jgi:hypothetical protein